MNLANQLTLFRIILIPLLVVVFYLPVSFNHWLAATLFTIAAITDWADGYVARRYDQSTPFGAFLDPVADKLMVAVALVILVAEHAHFWFVLPAVVIVGREIVISALREWMAELGKRASVAVSYIGKVKTTVQMIAIIVLLAFDPVNYPVLNLLGIVTLYGAAALTLWSMIIYLKAAWPELMAES
ncbi:CDP-diacylglycerol--glycerol-3-phosphate 3-phosphatidyltransferase [Pseudomaricurvus sp. HS19]|uniref:CDP-diacylglycerol--glycerol-3-phosphate 3-phosphatidyltransferase n=1 Tax=Pseudomaricurvus sp. HS19 TaxID=2692626 RepID=UPI00136C4731|nr:CDP-diacylglycerol--glycerol-3-phosphate 3-phosphatidyltransferase [Pseudomaricurvus sp. HS19]MYM62691.1 CDP-diacylglycerol--glycerol-3-phosphate 3-phosphatidyltransferase [Pseudomaricurvus sp. HS19]